MKDKADEEALALNNVQAQKRKEKDEEEHVAQVKKKIKEDKDELRKALAGKCSICQAKKKTVDEWVWENCINIGPRKCHLYVCQKSTCLEILKLHQPNCSK